MDIRPSFTSEVAAVNCEFPPRLASSVMNISTQSSSGVQQLLPHSVFSGSQSAPENGSRQRNSQMLKTVVGINMTESQTSTKTGFRNSDSTESISLNRQKP